MPSSFLFQSASASENPGGPSSATFSSLAAAAASSPASGSSGVKGASQEGVDRTSVDISQLTGNSPSKSATNVPTDFGTLAQMAPKGTY